MNQQPMTIKPSSKSAKNIDKPKRRGKFGNMLFNLLLLVAIIGLGYMFYRAEGARRTAENELQQTASQLEELRNSTQNSGAQVAEEVLSKLRNHMEVPTDPAPTVATITNIEQLRESNEFYQVAENGDHLVITEKRAILYDADRDIILDVVPVRINQATPAPSTDAALATPSTTVSPVPTDDAASPTPLVSPTTAPVN